MHSPINTTMGGREWLQLLILSGLWGASFFFAEILLQELSPLMIVAMRVSLGAGFLWLFLGLSGQLKRVPLRVWPLFLGMGLLNNIIPFNLIVWGQQHIASGLAAILNATTPLFSVLVAAWLLSDEKPTLMKYIGVGIGFVGTVLMIGPEALQSLGQAVWAQLAIIGASISYAFSAALGRKFSSTGLSPLTTAAGMLTVSALVLLPLALLQGGGPSVPALSESAWAALLGLAVLSTAVAYQLYFSVLKSAGATNILLVTFLIPVTTILLGTFFLGETLALIHYIGMGLIGLGLIAIDGRWLKHWQKSKSP